MLVHRRLLISLHRKEIKEEKPPSIFMNTVKDKVIPWRNASNFMVTLTILTSSLSSIKEGGMLTIPGVRWKVVLRLFLFQMQMLQ